MKYQEAKIYKLVSSMTEDVYYGSTIISLSLGLSKHKSDYKRYLKDNTAPMSLSRKILMYSDCRIELVENFPCESIPELHHREGWYQQNNPCVNKYIAGQAFLVDIKCECGMVIKEQRYMEPHLRSKFHCDKLGIILDEKTKEKQEQSINYQKEYNNTFKEERNEKSNKRYHENKEAINAKRKEEYKALVASRTQEEKDAINLARKLKRNKNNISS